MLLLLSKQLKFLGMMLLAVAIISFILYLVVSTIVKKYNKIVQIISKVVVETIVILMFVAASVLSLASSMMFYPHFDEISYEKLLGKEKAEELNVKIAEKTLSGWMIRNGQEDAPILLYFAGNGENSSTRALRLLEKDNERKPFENCNIIIFDYPGYGKSSGYPSETSLKEFGLNVYEWTKKTYQNSKIIVMGYSIGTGVANYVASEREVDGMILLAPYADGYDLYNNQVGIFYGPLRLLVTYKMEAIEFAEDIHVYPMVLASDSDEMIPYESSLRLSEAYPYGSEFITIEGIAHNDFWSNEESLNSIAHYIQGVLE